jgi:hypothetical protein
MRLFVSDLHRAGARPYGQTGSTSQSRSLLFFVRQTVALSYVVSHTEVRASQIMFSIQQGLFTCNNFAQHTTRGRKMPPKVL